MTASFSQHRPRDGSSDAIRDALGELRDERALADERIASATERRAGLLLAGSDAEIASAEAAKRDAELMHDRIDIMVSDLNPKLTEAVAREAGDARAEQVREASAVILAFNTWLAEHYEPAARIIAAGCALERLARRQRDALRPTGVSVDDLPEINWCYVGTTFRGLENLTRLPGITPGEPFVWP
jgi:hypothetical protein